MNYNYQNISVKQSNTLNVFVKITLPDGKEVVFKKVKGVNVVSKFAHQKHRRAAMARKK